MSKRSAAADQTVDITDLGLHQDLLTKNAPISTEKDFGLGNSPSSLDTLILSGNEGGET